MIDDFYMGELKIRKQTFGGVIHEHSVFDNADYDGLIGLAYHQLGVPPGIHPLFDSVVEQKKLKHNVFALYISRNEKYASRFWLGGVNKDYMFDHRVLYYHKVIKKSWWTLKLDKVLINGKDTGLCRG